MKNSVQTPVGVSSRLLIKKLASLAMMNWLLWGCTTMTNIQPAPLTFKEHNFGVTCYNASDVRVVYGRFPYECSIGKLARDKRPEDQKQLWGSHLGISAYRGPVSVQWRSKDGAEHAHQLNLEQIFNGRQVLHKEDPAKLFKLMPVSGNPSIIVEVNDRMLNVYMDTFLIVLPPDGNPDNRTDARNTHQAYRKTF